MTRYMHTLTAPNRGRPFNELYNVDTVEPGQEWLDIYHQVKEDLKTLGLKFEF